MTPERWRKIEALYRAAQKCGPEDRAVLLDTSDPTIRAQVERMLAMNSLDSPPPYVLEASTNIIVTVGSQLGPYKVEAAIGAGGMGTVYRALDTRLGRVVAIKTSNAPYNERFEREAHAISSLNHPNICTLYDVGPDYLVMELLEGSTLADEIKKGPLACLQVARYGAQIASALAEAHAHGIVHRDLKPSNIMVTRHGLKVLDFGLAKLITDPGLTERSVVMGTPAYMAPEQFEGQEPSSRTDLFALGLVLYEMATGRLPFPGASLGRMLISGAQPAVPPPSQARAGLPVDLDALVSELLEKNPAERWRSASEVAEELSAWANQISSPSLPAPRTLPRPVVAVPVLLLLFIVMVVGGIWLYRRSENRRWALERAIPEISRLTGEKKTLAAFIVLRKAESYLPNNPELAQIAKTIAVFTSVQSKPAGAKVEIQDYLAPEENWYTLGVTPLQHARIPNGYFRWRVSKPGSGEIVAAPLTDEQMQFTLERAPGTLAGMVPVPAVHFADMIDFIGWQSYDLPAFDIDQFEVTNHEYQHFVDNGGYRKQEYWREEFVKDGHPISWEQAKDLFLDPTGRPGPSTWQGGHFLTGQDNYPVSGVSWYEAAAYAVFRGKSLPALAQWYEAAPSDLAGYSISQSNFNGHGPVSIGSSQSVGPFGTYDMAGNVREWCWNTVDGDRKFILGGAWGTQTYQAYDPEALPPLDRSPMNGFRCVRNKGELAAAITAPVVRQTRDFSKARPVSAEVFRAYQTMYSYDRTPLNVKSEGVVENTADWTKEAITIDAAYGNERLSIYLFLPKNVQKPYQTVLFFPSARVNNMPASKDLGDLQFIDYVIQSGRALAYPIYKGTYERAVFGAYPGSRTAFDLVAKQSKDVGRSIDYLETRPEIDKSKIAYLGVSQGAADGVIFVALEDRFRAVILLDGGFFLGPLLPTIDQVNFAPRVKQPMLMMNGRYDFTFSPDRAQLPLFRMIGTPETDKKRVVLDTPHDISQDRKALSTEVLGWLDKYLGKVR